MSLPTLDSYRSDSEHSSRCFFAPAAAAADGNDEFHGEEDIESEDGEEDEDVESEDGEEEDDVESEDDDDVELDEFDDATLIDAEIHGQFSLHALFPNSKVVYIPHGFSVNEQGWHLPKDKVYGETGTIWTEDLTIVGLAAARANHNARISRVHRETDYLKSMVLRLGRTIMEKAYYESISSPSSYPATPYLFGVNPDCAPVSRLKSCATFKVKIGCHIDGVMYMWMQDLHKEGQNVTVEVPTEAVKKFLEDTMSLRPHIRAFNIAVAKTDSEEEIADVKRINRKKATQRRQRRTKSHRRRR